MKTVKPMYLFFDHLYESIEQIGEEVLSDWSHKEVPRLKFCVIDIKDQDEKELNSEGIYMANTMNEAEQEMNDWNE
ncbi:hypothetical protein [Psychrobacillus antarcticus]|uniref:hypothetical protein n=1 Tax=Psychrobacillus antarcticus TaxID=2879115 RepID=UPI002407E094|nr:hypothetical protein [Psychrobacillus antarcticus]